MYRTFYVREPRKRYPKQKNTPAVLDTPHAKAVEEAGGILLGFAFKPMPPGQNGGCGAPTHVHGTNGGTMRCGNILHRFGKAEPYYCGLCEEQMKKEKA